MAHIKSPVPITGTHVSLNFVNGEADTDRPWLIQWFRDHGYEVTEADEKPYDPTPPDPNSDPDPNTPPDGGQTGQDGTEDEGQGNDPTPDKKPVEGQETGEADEADEKPKSRRKRGE